MTNQILFVNSNHKKFRDQMKFSEVMIHYNYNMSEIARALGISRQYVAMWNKCGAIPYPMQCMLQVITDGHLKASKADSK